MTRVRAVELRLVDLPLVRPFRTSFGTSTAKRCVLVRVETDHAQGWGECVADIEPAFSEEFNEGAWLVLRDFLAPSLFAAGDIASNDLDRVFALVRGNPMAKGTLIDAFMDAELREKDVPLASYLGASRDRVECGVSVGITDTTAELLTQVDSYLDQGYRRIKLKIEPGLDVERVEAVRAAHPDILLSVDANAAYTLEDTDVFLRLDDTGLLMVGAAPALRRPGRTRGAAAPDRHRRVSGRVDPLGAARRRRDPARLVPHREHQAGQGRRRPGGGPGARRLTGGGVPGLVRRHARDGDRPGPEPCAGGDARVHASGRHQRVLALLPGRPHGAVRDGPRWNDGRADGPRHRRRSRAPNGSRTARSGPRCSARRTACFLTVTHAANSLFEPKAGTGDDTRTLTFPRSRS